MYEEIQSRIDLGYMDIGEHKLKNIANPIGVYQIRLDGPHTQRDKVKTGGQQPAVA